MPFSRSTLACLSYAVLVGCGAAENPSLGPEEADALSAEVQARVATALETMARVDAEGVLAHYAAEDPLVHAADGQVISGAAAVRDAYRANFEGVAEFLEWRVEPQHTTVLSPTSAIHTAFFDETILMSNGDTLRVKGIWTTGWKHVDGEWVIAHNAAWHAPAD